MSLLARILNSAGPTQARSGDPWFLSTLLATVLILGKVALMVLATRAAIAGNYAEGTYWLALYLVVK
jgi:hypothetical protein